MVCNFAETNPLEYDATKDEPAEGPVYWNWENDDCLRPCKILERELIQESYYYSVEVEEIKNHFAPNHCRLSHTTQKVLRTPEMAIALIDKEYTSDQFLSNSFRHNRLRA